MHRWPCWQCPKLSHNMRYVLGHYPGISNTGLDHLVLSQSLIISTYCVRCADQMLWAVKGG